MEELRELAERDAVAQQPVPVCDHTPAPEEPRVGRADDEERYRLGPRDELPRDLRERVPEGGAKRRLARRVVAFRDDLDVLPELLAYRFAEHLSYALPVVSGDGPDV